MMMRMPCSPALARSSSAAAPCARPIGVQRGSAVIAHVAQLPNPTRTVLDTVAPDTGAAFQKLVAMNRQQTVNRPQDVSARS